MLTLPFARPDPGRGMRTSARRGFVVVPAPEPGNRRKSLRDRIETSRSRPPEQTRRHRQKDEKAADDALWSRPGVSLVEFAPGTRTTSRTSWRRGGAAVGALGGIRTRCVSGWVRTRWAPRGSGVWCPRWDSNPLCLRVGSNPVGAAREWRLVPSVGFEPTVSPGGFEPGGRREGVAVGALGGIRTHCVSGWVRTRWAPRGSGVWCPRWDSNPLCLRVGSNPVGAAREWRLVPSVGFEPTVSPGGFEPGGRREGVAFGALGGIRTHCVSGWVRTRWAPRGSGGWCPRWDSNPLCLRVGSNPVGAAREWRLVPSVGFEPTVSPGGFEPGGRREGVAVGALGGIRTHCVSGW